MSIGAPTLQFLGLFPAEWGPFTLGIPRYHVRVTAAARYREEFLLGTGGMAEVWRASGPSGMVALKRLLPHAARDPSVAAAFAREGRLLERIQHPNVIGIHEVTHDERGTSLVLEYVEG